MVLGHVGTPAGAVHDLDRQRGEVSALDVVVEIGRRLDETTVRRLHHRGSIIETATAITLHSEQRTQTAFFRSLRPRERCASESMWPHGKRTNLAVGAGDPAAGGFRKSRAERISCLMGANLNTGRNSQGHGSGRRAVTSPVIGWTHPLGGGLATLTVCNC